MFDRRSVGSARLRSPAVTTRYRCSACGNLTRFDVVVQRRTREFHHFSVGGELTIEDEEMLDEPIERVDLPLVRRERRRDRGDPGCDGRDRRTGDRARRRL